MYLIMQYIFPQKYTYWPELRCVKYNSNNNLSYLVGSLSSAGEVGDVAGVGGNPHGGKAEVGDVRAVSFGSGGFLVISLLPVRRILDQNNDEREKEKEVGI